MTLREYLSHGIVIALSAGLLWVFSLIVIHKRVAIGEPNIAILSIEMALLLGFVAFSVVSVLRAVKREEMNDAEDAAMLQ